MKDMQFRLYATPGTRKALMAAGVPAEPINKISGDSPNIHDMLAAEDVSLIINTPTHGRLETATALSCAAWRWRRAAPA